ncbi:MAG: hypothetical protein AAF266_08955 [Planctomycetota bacterium]
MRALIAIVVLAVIAVFIGWLTIDTSTDRPSATIETQEIKKDLNALGDAAREAGAEIQQAADDAAEEPVGVD